MTTNIVCRVCDAELNYDNWHPSSQKQGNYICKECSDDTGM